MPLVVTRKRGAARPALSPEKSRELLGVLLVATALFLGLALGTYHPGDPSFFHRTVSEASRTRNAAGPVGAEVAALGFQFLGASCLAVPLFLLVGGWRRLRRREAEKVVGRGIGALLLLAALPALLQVLIADVPWREGTVPAGGALGVVLAEALLARLSLAGSLVVLLLALVAGALLAVQSTLDDLLRTLRARLAHAWQEWQLARARRKERTAKEKARRRVVAKHLQRAAEEKQRKEEPQLPVVAPHGLLPAPAAGPGHIDLPLRVTTRHGEGDLGIRRVAAAPAAAGELGDLDLAPERPRPATAPRPAAGERGGAARGAKNARQEPLFNAPAVPGALPPINLLSLDEPRGGIDEAELVRLGEVIRARCAEFGVEGTVEGISPGPVITVYEFQPAPGVKVAQIVNLQDDLALALRAESVRIDRMAGRSTLGIEVPNRERATIRLGALLADERFKKAPSVLTVALGTDIHGQPYYADLAGMPHLLVAGATGAGKSVGLQAMITSIIYRATRDEVQFIFIDPKRIELGVYADIPHLKAEVVVDPKKAANALRWAVAEMERRYRLLAEVHVRSIAYYNRAIQDPQVQQRLALSEGESALAAEDLKPLPYYVVVIDELADLMMVSSAEVEASIARLAQMARAVGIHLIVATQRPSVDVLTGTIKANFPCRISYATASRHDSRTILDQVGSEKLLGKGDMLFMPPGSSRILRLHGAYVSEQETAALVRWLKKQGRPELDPEVLADPEEGGMGGGGDEGDDELYDEASRLVVTERMASASFLQRRMRIGFSRAARLIDMMAREGLLGPPQGSKPREVLVKPDYFEELDLARRGER
ncbi:MAG TPA: DNA translocase FtsK [Thermoanaerobaculia bacterium]|nr:DNA translocase FtsK [Thermoanaerobaculia bacterium]